MSETVLVEKPEDDGESKDLLLRFTPRRDDAVEKNRLRDALRFLARKFGWDITDAEAGP